MQTRPLEDTRTFRRIRRFAPGGGGCRHVLARVPDRDRIRSHRAVCQAARSGQHRRTLRRVHVLHHQRVPARSIAERRRELNQLHGQSGVANPPRICLSGGRRRTGDRPAVLVAAGREYLASPAIPEFVKDALNGLGDAQLPGVFGYGTGELATVVNGSLWSLRYEALTYVFLLLLWTLLGESRIVAGVIAVAALLTWTVPFVEDAILGVAYTLPYFAGGVVMNWVHRRYGTNLYGAGVSVVLLLLACVFNLQVYAFALFGAYLVVFLGERRNPGSRIADKNRRLLLWRVSLRLAGRADGQAADSHDRSDASSGAGRAGCLRAGLDLVSC